MSALPASLGRTLYRGRTLLCSTLRPCSLTQEISRYMCSTGTASNSPDDPARELNLPSWEELNSTFCEDEDIEAATGPLVDDAYILDMSRGSVEGVLVWLHGADRDVSEIQPLFRRIALPSWRFILPHAQRRPLTSWQNKQVQTWFDVLHHPLRIEDPEDKNGLDKSAERIHELLDHEFNNFGSGEKPNVFLGGVGEGGAMALHAGLSYHKKLSGIISVAGWLALPKIYPEALSPINVKTPPKVLCLHGKEDDVVPFTMATERYKQLSQQTGIQAELWDGFSVQHYMDPHQMVGVQQWLLSTTNTTK